MLTVTRRVTTPFLQEIPKHVEQFDAYIYAIVQNRTLDKEVILDPCILDWDRKTITITISDKNAGIRGFEDLDPNFYEAVEAAFLAFIKNC